MHHPLNKERRLCARGSGNSQRRGNSSRDSCAVFTLQASRTSCARPVADMMTKLGAASAHRLRGLLRVAPASGLWLHKSAVSTFANQSNRGGDQWKM